MDKKKKIQNTGLDNEMKQFLSLVKKHEEACDTEIQASWDHVVELSSAEVLRINKKKYFRYILAGLSVAASVAILFVLSFHLFNSTEESSFVAELEKKIESIDKQDQIKLILSENHQVELENEAVVNYDKKGSITVNSASSTLAEEPQTKGNKLNHIIVPKGKRMHITLSDGTKMYVNADSHVIYPSVFDKDKREIAVEGEVFLEVAHNPESPFIVSTKGLSVRVLGTVFNVSAYKEQTISVVLVDGSVEVKSAAKEKILLNPSQMVRLKDGIMKKEEVDVARFICWKDNIMLLDNDIVSEVLTSLSRYYGIQIWCDKSVANRKLSGKLDLCESIDEVMDIVKVSASLNMEKIEGGGFHFLE